MADLKSTPWLHIRPQHWNHDPAEIVGTPSGLSALREAIDDALETRDGERDVFASDGEGYGVKVRCSRTLSGLGQPFYTDDVCDQMSRQRVNHLISHHKLIAKQTAEAIEALKWCRANGNPHLSSPKNIAAQEMGR
jgi:hypothetical protein